MKAVDVGVMDTRLRVSVSPESVATTVRRVVPTVVSSVTELVVAKPA